MIYNSLKIPPCHLILFWENCKFSRNLSVNISETAEVLELKFFKTFPICCNRCEKFQQNLGGSPGNHFLNWDETTQQYFNSLFTGSNLD